MLTPVGASVPRAALKLPFEDIVFKRVALGGGEPGKAGAHIADDIVDRPAAAHDLIGEGDERGQGL